MATLQQMRQRFSYKMDQPLTTDDIPLTGVFWPRAQVTEWINEARRELYSLVAQIENQTLLTETDGAFPANTRGSSIQTVLGISDDPLKIEEVRDVTNVTANSPGRLIPHIHHRNALPTGLGYRQNTATSDSALWTWDWYSANPMLIQIDPTPSSAMTLRIRYVPAVPTELSDVGHIPSELPTSVHDTLVDFAVIKAREKEEGHSLPDSWKAYYAKLERFKEAVEQRQVQNSRGTHRIDLSEYTGTGARYRY